jgi:hypothetical protein
MFKTEKGLSVHITRNYECNAEYQKQTRNRFPNNQKNSGISVEVSDHSSIGDETDDYNNNISNEDYIDLLSEEDNDSTLYSQQKDHIDSRNGEILCNEKEYKAGVKLLKLLQDANAPLYVFDSIIDWVIESLYAGVNFTSSGLILKRSKMISMIESRFCLKGVRPQTKYAQLKGYNKIQEITTHDFQQCLYSLLSDETLMRFENLLYDENFNVMIDLEKKKN